MTITSTIQIPLSGVEGLYDYDEEHDQLLPSKYVERRLNRYILTWRRTLADDRTASFAVNSILHHYGFGAWLLAKERPEHHSQTQWLHWLSRRKREGWQICTTASVAVAMLTTQEALFPLQPSGYQGWHKDGVGALFLGDHPNVSSICQEPVLATIVAFSRYRYFSPSKRFLHWLAENTFSIMYDYSLEFDIVKLVIITDRTLEIDLQVSG